MCSTALPRYKGAIFCALNIMIVNYYEILNWMQLFTTHWVVILADRLLLSVISHLLTFPTHELTMWNANTIWSWNSLHSKGKEIACIVKKQTALTSSRLWLLCQCKHDIFAMWMCLKMNKKLLVIKIIFGSFQQNESLEDIANQFIGSSMIEVFPHCPSA